MSKKITRNEYEAIRTAIYNGFGKEHDYVEIQRIGSILDDAVRFGVNWSARGTKSPEEAKEMAEALMQAAAIAEGLNSLNLEIDRNKKEEDLEEHKRQVELYQSFIESKAAQFAGIKNMEAK